MIVILDTNESILEFMDDSEVNSTVKDTYKAYKTLSFECELKDVKKDKNLFKQGNKIFVENTLFIINTEVDFDYIHKTINIDAEEVIVELNNTVFYIHENKNSRYVSGNTILISTNFLRTLFNGFYTVIDTDIPSLDNSKLKINDITGTITKYNLLKKIEETTGLIFKYSYRLEKNTIIKEVTLLQAENYGVTHSELLESIKLGVNTNKLEYSSDETKNALGIMPIITSEDNDNVNYTNILKQFYNLHINTENIDPYYKKYEFNNTDLIKASETVLNKLEFHGYLIEKVPVSHDETIPAPSGTYNGSEYPKTLKYDINIGLGQFLYLLVQNIVENKAILDLIFNPSYVNSSDVVAVFNADSIIQLAQIVLRYIESYGTAPAAITTSNGLLSFQMLILLFSRYTINKNSVTLKSNEYPTLNSILPDYLLEETHYAVDYDNFEYMPFLYTQNSSTSNNIPFKASMIQISGKTSYDITNYISESLPILVLKKIAGATDIILEIFKKNISQDTAESFRIKFKNVSQLQDNSNIEIDFSKKTIKCMKYVETTETVTQEVTTANNNVITVNHMPSCGHCRGTPYKRYTKTWIKKCPFCGSTNLKDNPKRVYEGEVTCGNCDADFCGYCGYEKLSRPRQHLTPGNANTTTTESKTITRGEYKEVTASEDVNTESSETKIGLYEVITEQSSLDTLYGDVSIIITGATLEKITCDSTKLYELAPFPYIKKRNTQYIYAPVTSADFNYTHVADNTPKLEPFETSEQSVEEVLIGCWKKLNGSGDNTKWLEKAENIEVDLVETNTQYNVGDYVYIKLPDTRVFKAQIIETSYNTKLKQDKNIKIGNITKESII